MLDEQNRVTEYRNVTAGLEGAIVTLTPGADPSIDNLPEDIDNDED